MSYSDYPRSLIYPKLFLKAGHIISKCENYPKAIQSQIKQLHKLLTCALPLAGNKPLRLIQQKHIRGKYIVLFRRRNTALVVKSPPNVTGLMWFQTIFSAMFDLLDIQLLTSINTILHTDITRVPSKQVFNALYMATPDYFYGNVPLCSVCFEIPTKVKLTTMTTSVWLLPRRCQRHVVCVSCGLQLQTPTCPVCRACFTSHTWDHLIFQENTNKELLTNIHALMGVKYQSNQIDPPDKTTNIIEHNMTVYTTEDTNTNYIYMLPEVWSKDPADQLETHNTIQDLTRVLEVMDNGIEV